KFGFSCCSSLTPSNLPAAKMVFKRYVEIGRVALVNNGKDHGKLCWNIKGQWLY
ncbi:unnamed protein product, partial [Brassica oleracea var. botrytis]